MFGRDGSLLVGDAVGPLDMRRDGELVGIAEGRL